MEFKLEKAQISHIDEIMQCIWDAQKYLANLGVDQWQDGYPEEEIISNDINNKNAFVLMAEAQVAAYSMFSTEGDNSYNEIKGKWLTNSDEYGVIHRMAVNAKYRGTGCAFYFFKEFEQKLAYSNIKSMRIDTHRDNRAMQNLLQRLNYEYCGIIQLERGGERLAYEKLID